MQLNTRTTFLTRAGLTVGTTALSDWEVLARVALGDPLGIRNAELIRVRDRKNGRTDTYLEIPRECGAKGRPGPLLKIQMTEPEPRVWN